MFRNIVQYILCAMASLTSFFLSLTERILLLLGWERIQLKSHSEVYGNNKAHIELVGALRRRKRNAQQSEKSQEKNNDMFAAKPNLAPAPLVNQNARASTSSSTWTSGGPGTVDAFDTAVTGTV